MSIINDSIAREGPAAVKCKTCTTPHCAISLDAPDGQKHRHSLTEPDQSATFNYYDGFRGQLPDAISKLKLREQFAVRAFFGIGCEKMKGIHIAQKLKVSRNDVFRIKKAGLEALRNEEKNPSSPISLEEMKDSKLLPLERKVLNLKQSENMGLFEIAKALKMPPRAVHYLETSALNKVETSNLK